MPITTPTAKEDAELKSHLAVSVVPKKISERKQGKWGNPESWKSEFTGEKLQIQENDIWQCAQALERELVFVTLDKRVNVLADVSGGKLLHIAL